MKKRKRLDAKSRKAYIEGLKRYQDRGVSVLIDGKEPEEREWEKIFEIREDGGFYMGDYILEDVSAEANGQIQEEEAPYGASKRLKEIRFDIVYNR